LKFIYVRHGQSESNATRMVSDGHTKLSVQGVEQAKRTGQELKGHNVMLVVCSTYVRSQQTAEIIAGELGIDLKHIKVIDELRERGLGDTEGEPNVYSQEWFFNNDTEHGVESRQDLIDRCAVALEKLAEINPASGVMAVVGHAISGFYLRQVAKGRRSFDQFDPHEQMENADFVIIETNDKDPK
jgi:broad specificity phosphatase PhoE